jgi:hypothetical protein
LTDYANEKKGGMKLKKNLLRNHWANCKEITPKWAMGFTSKLQCG